MNTNGINIDINFFNNSKIKYLKNMDEGEKYIVVWINFLVIAEKSKKNGLLYHKKFKKPYDVKLLAIDINYSEEVVKYSIALFESLKMITVSLTGIQIKNWSKYQINTDVDLKITNECSNNFEYQKIVDLYNNYCSNLPQVKALNTKRNKAIKKATEILKSIKGFEDYFILISQSDFLMGENKYDWKPNFDWCLQEHNIIEILEGKYKTNVNLKNNKSNAKETLQNAYDNVDNFFQGGNLNYE